MARTKQKNPKLAAEISVMDEVYLETKDALMSLKLKECEIDEAIANLEVILKEEEAKADPNRSVFHIASTAEFEVVTDEIRRKLFDEKERKNALQIEIASIEQRIDALHKVKKLLYKIDNPETEMDSGSLIQPVESEISSNLSVSESFNSFSNNNLNVELINRLSRTINGLELSDRFINFDSERSRHEIIGVKSEINDIINYLEDCILIHKK